MSAADYIGLVGFIAGGLFGSMIGFLGGRITGRAANRRFDEEHHVGDGAWRRGE